MSSRCKQIQERLSAEGPRALRSDDEAQNHLVECETCFQFLESLTEIDDGLKSMAPIDAPDHVVDALLARPEIASVAGESAAARSRSMVTKLLRPRPLVWSSLAAASLIVMIFTVGLRFRLPDEVSTREMRTPATEVEEVDRPGARGDEGAGRDKNDLDARFSDEFITDLPVPGRYYRNEFQNAPGVSDSDDRASANSIEEMETITGGASISQTGVEVKVTAKPEVAQIEYTNTPDEPEPSAKRKAGEIRSRLVPVPAPAPMREPRRAPGKKGPQLAGVGGVTTPVLLEDGHVNPTYPELARVARLEGRVILQVVVRSDGNVGDIEVLNCTRSGVGFEQSATDAVRQWRFVPAMQGDVAVDVYWTITIDFDLDTMDNSLLQTDEATRSAREFLAARNNFEDLTFKAASGYWSNSYVPGDPALRLLQARLAGHDRSAVQAYLPSARLHDAARQVGQPFDTPAASALAVYVQADRSGLTGPGRVLLQVGLEGTPRHGGRRPAMNVALVFDLRDEIDTDVAIGLRALLEAFNRAKEPGDRFRLFVAGRAGGCVVAAEDFRHGYLEVTLDHLLDSEHSGLDLVAAVSSAIESVANDDDPDAPLGSNAVVLISGRPFGDAARSLADLAHQGAVAGIPLSVIGVGDDVALDDIDLVTLAGQGSRRLLDDPASATDLVERELSAASRAIARAVRLRIRLAPGVKLVDVLGSERLDEPSAARVRQAERSIDLRLAHSLGIEADRGEDEEGIQIVVPSFYAGDSHTILLDVVVPGPGPVADVTVRYKDLVHLRNGTSRASLSLGREARPAGPLERNVLENLLSLELSETLWEAGSALAAGDRQHALSLLEERAALLDGLRRELPGFDTDPDLLRDLAMLGEYCTLLATDFTSDSGRRAYLADSLRYAARLTVLPAPLETTS